MTSNTTPSGEAFLGMPYPNSSLGLAFLAFDGNDTTQSYQNNVSAGGDRYVGYTFPYEVSIRKFKIRSSSSEDYYVWDANLQYLDDDDIWKDTGIKVRTSGVFEYGIVKNNFGKHKSWRLFYNNYERTDGRSQSNTFTIQFYGRA